MVFTKRLREGVRSGAITTSIRIWKSPKVTAGKRYAFEDGEIEIESIEQIAIQDINHEMAVESGFLGVIDLLKVAKHGSGDNVYLVRFHFIPPSAAVRPKPRHEQPLVGLVDKRDCYAYDLISATGTT